MNYLIIIIIIIHIIIIVVIILILTHTALTKKCCFISLGLKDLGTALDTEFFHFATSALEFWDLSDINLHETLNGEGIVIAVLDSGIYASHKAFQAVNSTGVSKYLSAHSRNFCNARDIYTCDGIGHGTCCAGIAAGIGKFTGHSTNIFESGVAPRSKVIMCKVYDEKCPLQPEAVYKALCYLNELQDSGLKIHVVLMSLGFPESHLQKSDFFSNIQEKISNLANRRTICVAAAGNDAYKKTTAVVFPASCQSIVAVGSHDTNGELSKFSPEGVCCSTLGENIIAPTINCADSCVHGCYGTSMAAAAVAGLVALIVQAQLLRKKPIPTFADVKKVLERMRNPGDRLGSMLRPRQYLQNVIAYDLSVDALQEFIR